MTHEKLLERIRRLYAMSNDTSSPAEAAIAAKRVRSLMDQHQVTVEDLEKSEYGSAVFRKSYLRPPLYIRWLMLGVGRYNDCNTTWSSLGGGKNSPMFQGFENDALAANLMLDYLYKTMERHLRAYLKSESPEDRRIASNSFRAGYCADMQKRLLELCEERRTAEHEAGSAGALIVLKGKLVAAKFGVMKTSKSKSKISDSNAQQAGQKASQRTGIEKQVRGASTRHQLG